MKKIIIIIVVVLVLIMGITVGVYCYFNYPKIESIDIKEDAIELYKGETYSIDYEIYPTNAKNVNIVFDGNADYVSVSDKEILALETGKTKVCYIQKDNHNVKDCIDITIKSKRDKLIEYLDSNTLIFRKKDEGVYYYSDGILDLNNYTYRFVSNENDIYADFTYYFLQDYISGYETIGEFSVEYFYNTDTRSLSCLGNTLAFHNAVCAYSSQQITSIL